MIVYNSRPHLRPHLRLHLHPRLRPLLRPLPDQVLGRMLLFLERNPIKEEAAKGAKKERAENEEGANVEKRAKNEEGANAEKRANNEVVVGRL